MLLFMFACAADDPTSQPTSSPETIIAASPESTPEPTPDPEPIIPSINVTLNNYHTRYFNDETQFDIAVISNLESYDIVYIPIESSSGLPALDINGFPYDIGEYRVAIFYAFGDIEDKYETDIVVSIVERPTLARQLATSSQIPSHADWGEEIFLIAQEDMTIETDYYIAYLNAGDEYSSWFFPLLDIVIDYVHDITGLYLPDSNEKVHLRFAAMSGSGYWNQAGRDSRTGNLFMSLQENVKATVSSSCEFFDYYIGLADDDAGPDGWTDEWIEWMEDYMEILIVNWVWLGGGLIAHEYAHVLDFAFLNDDDSGGSWIYTEAFAQFIDTLAKEHFTNNHHSRNPAFVNIISNYATNRLEYALTRDNGAGDLGNAGRTFGAIFFLYIYEEFGMPYVLEIMRSMNERPSSPSRLIIFQGILGYDITDSFPAWIHENIERLTLYI
jgi:hypothetical protein